MFLLDPEAGPGLEEFLAESRSEALRAAGGAVLVDVFQRGEMLAELHVGPPLSAEERQQAGLEQQRRAPLDREALCSR